MIKRNTFYTLTSLLLSATILSACSSNNAAADSRIDYKSAQTGNPLILPPNLLSQTNQNKLDQSTSLSLNQYQQQAKQSSKQEEVVLPDYANVSIENSGNQRWLVTSISADKVWSETLKMLQDNGLGVDYSDPTVGTIETVWSENRADIPDGFVRSVLSKYVSGMVSASTRDKFKIRLERKDSETLVFITHYGMKNQALSSNDSAHTWVERPRDPELEAELLSRLKVQLGGNASSSARTTASQADDYSAVQFNDRGNGILLVNRSVNNLWLQIGNILDDGAQFHVTKQEDEQSSYQVVWRDISKEPSTLSKLAFWSDNSAPTEEFSVKLVEESKNVARIEIVGIGSEPLSSEAMNAAINRIKSNVY